jgi:hypothetical protein
MHQRQSKFLHDQSKNKKYIIVPFNLKSKDLSISIDDSSLWLNHLFRWIPCAIESPRFNTGVNILGSIQLAEEINVQLVIGGNRFSVQT